MDGADLYDYGATYRRIRIQAFFAS
jgi:hypothetical protein